MNIKKTQFISLFMYSVPWFFIGAFGDITFFTIGFYVLMIVGFTASFVVAIKIEKIPFIFLGNAMSYISSLLFIYLFATERWGYFFKPFPIHMLHSIVAIIMFLIQLLFLCSCFKRINR